MNGQAYIFVDCAHSKMTFLAEPAVLPKDEKIMATFKKITISNETVFFKNAKALVWYGKNFKGDYEYFSAPGEHPETGKYLRPITKYHIAKYLSAFKAK